MTTSVETALRQKYPDELVTALLDSYREIESNFVLGKWKASELDAGHFVEAARRVIEHQLLGSYTPLSASLSNFHDGELKKYEQAAGDDSFRILIPRVLKAIYNIRSKRGVGHLGAISANEMDSTFIVYASKWVMAELVRISAKINPTETQKLMDSIVERRLSVLWKHEGVSRILDIGLKAREQILVLLYDESPQSQQTLQSGTEYKNASNFRKILQRLHKDRLLEHSSGMVSISPKGIVAAEAVISRAQ